MSATQRSARPAALSPSSTREYLQCPLKFRYSVVDRIPQPPTLATIRGTLVHAVLEHLFDLPGKDRTWETANSLVAPRWQELVRKHPNYPSVVEEAASTDELFATSEKLLGTYFTLERPEFLDPETREAFVEARLPSGILLRGIIDRVDVAPDGRIRVVDYKTGKSPARRFMDEALFQMRFYALLLRQQGQTPARLQLLYLRDGQVLTLDPLAEDVDRFEVELNEIWGRILRDTNAGSFAPRRTPLCGWCPYQSMCPLFGGTIPPADPANLERIRNIGPALIE